MHLRLASRGNFEVACSNHHFTNFSFSIAAPSACNHCLSSTIKVSDFNTLTSFSSLLNKHLYVFHFPAHSNYSIFIYLHFVLVFYSILKFSNRSHSLRLANFSCSIRAYNCLPMCKRICWYPEVKYYSKKFSTDRTTTRSESMKLKSLICISGSAVEAPSPYWVAGMPTAVLVKLCRTVGRL